VLEGIALEQAVATNQVARSTGVPINRYTAVGGGAASDLWAQILADASNRAVIRTTTVEASSLGAAMAAAAGAGLFGSIAEASSAMAGRSIRTFEPVPAQVARYAELKSIYADLWPLLASWNRRLATFAEHKDV
jgi:xylulokinase